MSKRSFAAALAITVTSFVTVCWADDVKQTIRVQVTNGDAVSEADWTYLKPDEITKDWNLCVLLPHLKDSYWVAADYGIADQVKRSGVSMSLYEAGGYSNLSTQLGQLDNCIAQGADGIILAAISADGVGALVKKATDANIPVIDFATGVNEKTTSGHALVSYYTMANVLGQYLVEQANGKPTKVGFFPGPQGAGWSDDAVRGFEDAVKGSPVEIVVTRRGDTGVNTQLDLISNALLTYDDMEWVVGLGTAAEAGAVAVRNAGLGDKVKVAAFNTSPKVQEYIASGEVAAAPSDFPPLQARLAVDMALRLLEKKDLVGTRVGPKPELLTKETADKFPLTDMYSPEGYSVVFNVTKGE